MILLIIIGVYAIVIGLVIAGLWKLKDGLQYGYYDKLKRIDQQILCVSVYNDKLKTIHQQILCEKNMIIQ